MSLKVIDKIVHNLMLCFQATRTHQFVFHNFWFSVGAGSINTLILVYAATSTF